MGTVLQKPDLTRNRPGMKVLTGCNQISKYLRTGVRTVQRWEILGLPVHRVGSGPRRLVIAFAEELDAWEKAAPARSSAVIAALKAKVCSLEIELASLIQQSHEHTHRSSPQNLTETRSRAPENGRSARP